MTVDEQGGIGEYNPNEPYLADTDTSAKPVEVPKDEPVHVVADEPVDLGNEQTEEVSASTSTERPEVVRSYEIPAGREPFTPSIPSDGKHDEPLVVLTTSKTDFKEIRDLTEKKLVTGDKIQQWVEATSVALQNYHSDDVTHHFDREGSDWKNQIKHGELTIGPKRAKFNVSKRANSVVSGEDALLLARQSANLGTTLDFPLFHTGIRLGIRAPLDAELLQVEQAISLDKINLGRRTAGASFANTSIYMFKHAVDLALRKVFYTNYDSIVAEDLRKVIRVTDIPRLLVSMMITVYPHGYYMVRPCVSNPEKCTHIDEGTVNLNHMLQTDDASLSPIQKSMLLSDAAMTADRIETYQNAHVAKQYDRVELMDGIWLHLEVPTIQTFMDSGRRWVDGIVEMIKETFKQEPSEKERDAFIIQQAMVTRMRRYAHWIKKIEYVDDIFVTDVLDIERTLNEWSGEDELYKTFKTKIETFISGATIDAFGIPHHTCSKCNSEPHPAFKLKNLEHLIAVDALECFFTLLSRRSSKTLTKV